MLFSQEPLLRILKNFFPRNMKKTILNLKNVISPKGGDIPKIPGQCMLFSQEEVIGNLKKSFL